MKRIVKTIGLFFEALIFPNRFPKATATPDGTYKLALLPSEEYTPLLEHLDDKGVQFGLYRQVSNGQIFSIGMYADVDDHLGRHYLKTVYSPQRQEVALQLSQRLRQLKNMTKKDCRKQFERAMGRRQWDEEEIESEYFIEYKDVSTEKALTFAEKLSAEYSLALKQCQNHPRRQGRVGIYETKLIEKLESSRSMLVALQRI